MRLRNIGLIAALVTGLGTTAQAAKPAALATDNDLSSDCLEQSCQVAVTFAVLDLKKQDLADEDFNSELGFMAVELYELAKETEDSKLRQQIAVAMRRLAEFSTDDLQKETLLWVANGIRTGDESLFDLDDPFAASPS